MVKHIVEMHTTASFERTETYSNPAVPGATFFVGHTKEGTSLIYKVHFDTDEWSPETLRMWVTQSSFPIKRVSLYSCFIERLLRFVLPKSTDQSARPLRAAMSSCRFKLLSIGSLSIVLEKITMPDPDQYYKIEPHEGKELILSGSYVDITDETAAKSFVHDPKPRFVNSRFRDYINSTPHFIAAVLDKKPCWRLLFLRKKRAGTIFVTPMGIVSEAEFYRRTEKDPNAFSSLRGVPTVICKNAITLEN